MTEQEVEYARMNKGASEATAMPTIRAAELRGVMV
jgi:hypothetical protein